MVSKRRKSVEPLPTLPDVVAQFVAELARAYTWVPAVFVRDADAGIVQTFVHVLIPQGMTSLARRTHITVRVSPGGAVSSRYEYPRALPFTYDGIDRAIYLLRNRGRRLIP